MPFLVLALLFAADSDWPQFRGPNAQGAAKESKPPVEFHAKLNRKWSTALPSGHSSPAVAASRVYITAFDKAANRLELIALDLESGKILWRRAAPESPIEKVHEVSSPATATPAANGKRVYAYFGSYGLLAYDADGKELWKRQMPMPKMNFGSGTSPVLAGDALLLSRDDGDDPHLLAIDAATGKELWKRAYSSKAGFGAYATPVLWEDSVLIHRAGELAAFSLADGKPLWSHKISSSGATVPATGQGMVYVAAWSNFGEEDHLPPLPTFDELLKSDTNADGKLTREEFPDNVYFFARPNVQVPGSSMSVKRFFDFVDPNKDGVDRDEWTKAEANIQKFRKMPQIHGLIALKPGGEKVWTEPKSIPEVPSPLYYEGRTYMVVNGGIVTCSSAADGKLIYRARLGAPGAYFASPVAADGKVYFSSAEGIVTVVKHDAEALEVLARNDIAEPLYATPAFSGSTILVRSSTALHAFQQK